mmetsp:Transcript_31740/g.72884  ORF Transcript_31740/g.72884 Transcript_31740/m.72884 type:complete len:310 (-) Transcript_31740:82-1011(-)
MIYDPLGCSALAGCAALSMWQVISDAEHDLTTPRHRRNTGKTPQTPRSSRLIVEESMAQLWEANECDLVSTTSTVYNQKKREIASDQYTLKLQQGYQLTEDLCYRCAMPRMSRDDQLTCVVCPALTQDRATDRETDHVALLERQKREASSQLDRIRRESERWERQMREAEEKARMEHERKEAEQRQKDALAVELELVKSERAEHERKLREAKKKERERRENKTTREKERERSKREAEERARQIALKRRARGAGTGRPPTPKTAAAGATCFGLSAFREGRVVDRKTRGARSGRVARKCRTSRSDLITAMS